MPSMPFSNFRSLSSSFSDERHASHGSKSLDYPRICKATGIHLLPNEVLAIVLRVYIWDYFSYHVCLDLRSLPAPLHVCRQWRQVAISTPSCWTRLNVRIDTQSGMKYVRRGIFQRNTRAKVVQDTLNNYFKWAKDAPINLSIQFGIKFGAGVKDALIHWFGTNMPRLRTYKEVTGYGLFMTILPALSANIYEDLTELKIGRVPYGYNIDGSLTMPSLRVLRLPTEDAALSRCILEHLNAPNLLALHTNADYSKLTVTVSQRFSRLTELAQVYPPVNQSNIIQDSPKFSQLKRVIFVTKSHGVDRFFPVMRKWFANVHDWDIDSIFVGELTSMHLTQNSRFDFVKSLSIRTTLTDTLRETRNNDFWSCFPNVVNLSLKCARSSRDFTFVVEREPCLTFYWDRERMGGMLIALLELLAEKSEETGSPRACADLKTIEVLDLILNPEALLSFLNVLQSRRSSVAMGTNDLEKRDSGCQLTFRRSSYHDYVNKIHLNLNTEGMSFSDFHRLVRERMPSNG